MSNYYSPSSSYRIPINHHGMRYSPSQPSLSSSSSSQPSNSNSNSNSNSPYSYNSPGYNNNNYHHNQYQTPPSSSSTTSSPSSSSSSPPTPTSSSPLYSTRHIKYFHSVLKYIDHYSPFSLNSKYFTSFFSFHKSKLFLTLLLLVLFVFIYLFRVSVTYTSPLKYPFSFITKVEYNYDMCIIGNAEKIELGEKISKEYFPNIPSIWMIWGSKDTQLFTPINHFYWNLNSNTFYGFSSNSLIHYIDGRNTTWSTAIEKGLKILENPQSGIYACEWFFFLDDDVEFEVTKPKIFSEELNKEIPNTPEIELLSVLKYYKPAAVAFNGWSHAKVQIGEITSSSTKDIPAVSTLYAFDNSDVVFHSSILPFFIPLGPRGEGGFDGQWTLPAHFFMAFVPSMYPGNCVLALNIRYKNNIQPNPKKTLSIDANVAVHEGSRHVYEYPQNNRYKAFLRNGMKSISKKFGVDMNIESIWWTPEIGKPPFNDYLNRINSFYDILHPQIADRPFIKQRWTKSQLVEYRASHSIFQIKIIVFGKDRLDSLKRLIHSIFKADFSYTPHVDLQIEIDYSKVQNQVRDFVDGIKWTHGTFNAAYSPIQRGLRASIMKSWHPKSLDEFAIFLEDDIEVSPLFLIWAYHSIQQYYYLNNGMLTDNKCIGVSLYAPIWSQIYDAPLQSIDPFYKTYALQQPCSWGAVYFPHTWLEFSKWFDENEQYDPLIPDLININRWPMEKSWKKYLIRWMVQYDTFMIYPNFYNDGSGFSTNHVELGTNDLYPGFQKAFRAKYETKLITKDQGVNFDFLPTVEDMPKLDVFENFVEEYSHSNIPWKAFNNYTIIIPSHEVRRKELLGSIQWWQQAPSLGKIIVRWYDDVNATEKTTFSIPDDIAKKLRVPVVIQHLGTFNINKRFLPSPDVETLCIFSADDDVRIRIEDVEFAFYVWQLHPDQIIGFTYTARGYSLNKIQDNEKLKYLYGNVDIEKDISKATIALTGAAFMHKKYLDEYWSNRPPQPDMRKLAEKYVNGEDIIMNCLIAQITGKGPMFVNGLFNITTMKSAASLWRRPGHLEQRSMLLTEALNKYSNGNAVTSAAPQPATPTPNTPTGLLGGKIFPAKWMPEWMVKHTGLPPTAPFNPNKRNLNIN